jgi:hypothetical protein
MTACDTQAFVADTLPNSQIVAVVLSSSSAAATDDAVTKELADSLRADGFALGAASSATASADIARHYGVAIAAGTATTPTLLVFKNFNEDALSDDASSSSLTAQAPVVYAASEPWTSAALHAWCSAQVRCYSKTATKCAAGKMCRIITSFSLAEISSI